MWPSFKVCPICVGVSGTWTWILIGIYFGSLETENWKLMAAILMGGSVVGIAYQLAVKIRPEKVMAWKVLFIPAGFILAYNLIYFSWVYLTLSAAIIFLLLLIFLIWPVSSIVHSKNNSQNIEGLEDKMKNCC